ncbi:MAG: hypothetical protein LKE52_02085 [Bacilli bacterium]|jgi:uncharacterized membrane protein|nr:hypothetical protein [Bacilli bacterium]
MNSRRRNDQKIRKITGVSMLLALAIVLQILSNYIAITIGTLTLSITLALIPIVLAGILYGPLSGFLVGTAVGAITIAAPSTLANIAALQAVSAHPGMLTFYVVLLCLFKMGLAGLFSALLFSLLNRFHHFAAGVVVASLSAPLFNTGLYILFTLTMLRDEMMALCGVELGGLASTLMATFISVNFLVEFAVNAALSPAILYLTKYFFRKKDIGSSSIGIREEKKAN